MISCAVLIRSPENRRIAYRILRSYSATYHPTLLPILSRDVTELKEWPAM
jgi:hypothetical protein